MSSSKSKTPRREFLGQIAASAMVLAAGSACSSSSTGAQSGASAPAPVPAGASPSPTHWDDSWFGRLTAKHKAVFDSPQIEEGLVLANASGYIRGMRDAIGAGDHDVQAVVVVRHAAIPMAFNDAMWRKYEIGKDKKIKGTGGEEWAAHNPYLGSTEAAGGRPQATLSWLGANGHVLLGCDLATRNYSGVLARALKLDRQTVYEDLKANLVPGLILQPTGVYAALRAQEAGCAYIRST